MRGVNHRKFLQLWHLVLSATNPGLTADRWQVADVQWSRVRHNYTGHAYSFSLEIHTLERQRAGRLAWRLLVVVETWWGSDREPLRAATWARAEAGDAHAIIDWVEEQRARHSAKGESSDRP